MHDANVHVLPNATFVQCRPSCPVFYAVKPLPYTTFTLAAPSGLHGDSPRRFVQRRHVARRVPSGCRGWSPRCRFRCQTSKPTRNRMSNANPTPNFHPCSTRIMPTQESRANSARWQNTGYPPVTMGMGSRFAGCSPHVRTWPLHYARDYSTVR